MKKVILPVSLFMTALVFFAAGVHLQREHALLPLRRLIQGRPLQPLVPGTTILDIDYARLENLKPELREGLITSLQKWNLTVNQVKEAANLIMILDKKLGLKPSLTLLSSNFKDSCFAFQNSR